MDSPSSKVTLLRDEDITPDEGRWTLDDNIAAQDKGWIIAAPAKDCIPELFSLSPRWGPAQVLEDLIKPYIRDGGLEAKAYTTLVGLKLKYPDHRFLHEKSGSELPFNKRR